MPLDFGCMDLPHCAVAWLVLAVLLVLLLRSDELESRPGLPNSNNVSESSEGNICAEIFFWCAESVEAVEQHVSDTEDIERGVKDVEGGVEGGIEVGVKSGEGGGVKGACTKVTLTCDVEAIEGDHCGCTGVDGSLKFIKGTEGTRHMTCEEVVASKSTS